MQNVNESNEGQKDREKMSNQEENKKETKTKRFNAKKVEKSYNSGDINYKEEQEKKKVEMTHKRATLYIEKDLLDKFDEAVRKTKVTKVKLINDILKDFIEELEDEGFPFK